MQKHLQAPDKVLLKIWHILKWNSIRFLHRVCVTSKFSCWYTIFYILVCTPTSTSSTENNTCDQTRSTITSKIICLTPEAWFFVTLPTICCIVETTVWFTTQYVMSWLIFFSMSSILSIDPYRYFTSGLLSNVIRRSVSVISIFWYKY